MKKYVSIQQPEKQEIIAKTRSSMSLNAWMVPLSVLAFVVLVVAALFFYFLGPPRERFYDYAFEIDRFSGYVEIYSHKTNQWVELTRKAAVDAMIHSSDQVRTGKGADIDLNLPGFIDVRVKPASELHLIPARSEDAIHLKLNYGELLGTTDEAIGTRKAQLEYGSFRMTTGGGSFLLHGKNPNEFSLSVLDGAVEFQDDRFNETATVSALEMVSTSEADEHIPTPQRVTYQEWRSLNEIRDLTFTPTEEIKKQRDLTKEAGSLFQHVFDEGTFYTPNFGYSERKFYRNGDGTVILRAHYDVYPQGSYSGLYLKTRGLDISKFKGLSFELKADSAQPIPEMVRIEMKDRMSTVRGFAVKPISSDWRLYAFDFNAQKPTPVDEIVFVFENTRVGPLSLKGTVYLKNLTIR